LQIKKCTLGEKMVHSGFSIDFNKLPKTLPIFPLEGVLLLPYGRLPLNIFEPRYLAMTDDALSTDRLIGIVQPTVSNSQKTPSPVFKTGCAGRITAFSETEDGRYLITLSGLIRFDVGEEIPTPRGYRRIVPDWNPYKKDYVEVDDFSFSKDRLLAALKKYFEKKAIDADWETINKMDDARLVTTLAMICPFDPPEQQVLLMARDMSERAETIISLLEISTHDVSEAGDVRH
jgi:Lon protease-like protein